MAPVRAHLFISGAVQGVFFRVTCRDVAASHGLSGWVRNMPDGRVEAVAEGEPGPVEQIIAWCRRGPSGARVDEVDVRWEKPEGEKDGFRIVG